MINQKETKESLRENKKNIRYLRELIKASKRKISHAKKEISANYKSFRTNFKYLKNKNNEWSETKYTNLKDAKQKCKNAIVAKYSEISKLNKLFEEYKLLKLREKELKFNFTLLKNRETNNTTEKNNKEKDFDSKKETENNEPKNKKLEAKNENETNKNDLEIEITKELENLSKELDINKND